MLQERSFERIGGVKTINPDVRLIAATNKDLSFEVKEGRFRQDLYYRLSVVTTPVPPLRERLQDIGVLVNYFLERYNRKFGRRVRSVSSDAMGALLAYNFPGNIRELENILERAIPLTEEETLNLSDLPLDLSKKPGNKNKTDLKTRSKEAAKQAEKVILIQALEETEWNVTNAAQKLRMSRRGLQLKMKEYKLREISC